MVNSIEHSCINSTPFSPMEKASIFISLDVGREASTPVTVRIAAIASASVACAVPLLVNDTSLMDLLMLAALCTCYTHTGSASHGQLLNVCGRTLSQVGGHTALAALGVEALGRHMGDSKTGCTCVKMKTGLCGANRRQGIPSTSSCAIIKSHVSPSYVRSADGSTQQSLHVCVLNLHVHVIGCCSKHRAGHAPAKTHRAFAYIASTLGCQFRLFGVCLLLRCV